MVRFLDQARKRALVCGLALALIVPADAVQAGEFKVLYNFQGFPDGDTPSGNLLADRVGNLFGATVMGGANGYGTVFKLAPDGTESIVYSFSRGSAGAYPHGNLIADRVGNLYGTTQYGGQLTGPCGTFPGCGIVFVVTPGGSEEVLYAFQGGSDGELPCAGLIRDKAGNFYGTTNFGGAGWCNGMGCGTVFELTRSRTESVLYRFCSQQNCTDGSQPFGPLIADAAGNLFGTTTKGGTNDLGTVFKLATNGKETVLHSFAGGGDGSYPEASLLADKVGNIYGTTALGGGNSCSFAGCGTVFKLAPDGTETVLYSFKGGSDGAVPTSSLVVDREGNLYGVTSSGGFGCRNNGCGTVFKLQPNGTETVLVAFHLKIGANPNSLVADKAGNLYGTAVDGYSRTVGYGTVFTLKE